MRPSSVASTISGTAGRRGRRTSGSTCPRPGTRRGKPAHEIRVVVHEDLLLRLADEPVGGAALGRHHDADPHAELLLVGAAGRRVGRRSVPAAERGRDGSRGRASARCPSVGAVRCSPSATTCHVSTPGASAAADPAPTRPGTSTPARAGRRRARARCTVPVVGQTENQRGRREVGLGRDLAVAHRLHQLVRVEAAVAVRGVPARRRRVPHRRAGEEVVRGVDRVRASRSRCRRRCRARAARISFVVSVRLTWRASLTTSPMIPDEMPGGLRRARRWTGPTGACARRSSCSRSARGSSAAGRCRAPS